MCQERHKKDRRHENVWAENTTRAEEESSQRTDEGRQKCVDTWRLIHLSLKEAAVFIYLTTDSEWTHAADIIHRPQLRGSPINQTSVKVWLISLPPIFNKSKTFCHLNEILVVMFPQHFQRSWQTKTQAVQTSSPPRTIRSRTNWNQSGNAAWEKLHPIIKCSRSTR